ncbi:cytochrome P450 monooxygenase [Fomitopsis serialis]|uniref:cytochrome P450 monooxygenase n=1 Tax=Fomitopsis serialis TaxID=139415 RepID=UPI002008C11D|nr:cytochrome P450 monooxygenase [Neoantrodia serialis]KAH9926682.1 cytochrome P450 monooxygenase [Neoantrodia serialis]
MWKIAVILTIPYRSSIRHLRGPAATSWLSGNIHRWQVDDAAWIATYGPTFKFKGWFCVHALYTLDAKALNHVLTHSSNYPKPGTVAFMLGKFLSVRMCVSGASLCPFPQNPAFWPAQIRELESIFVEKAHELKNVWKARTLMSQDAVTIDVASDMSKTALDMIGLAGFNYPLNSLDESGKPNELNAAFTSVFGALTGGGRGTVYTLLLHHMVPLSRYLPGEFSRLRDASQEVTRRVGMQLIREKKADVVKAMSSGKEWSEVLGSRDLLTLLIKANMNSNIPEHQRLSDEDVLAREFLIAGHETTSYGMTWCLFALAQVPEVQQKLREELLAVETEAPSMDELNALPYLDAVVRETLRVHPPVRHTVRVALKDDVIPFGTPFYDRHGRVQDCVRQVMRKDMQVIIPIQTINTSEAIWGEDTSEFRPERWEMRPDAAQSVPGVWGNLMTFLGGPHACIGYRFALMEMKTLLFVLVRSFTFGLALPAEDIIKKSAIVQRPYIRNALEKGSQLPLRVTLYKPT